MANNGCTKQTAVDADAGSGALVKTQYFTVVGKVSGYLDFL